MNRWNWSFTLFGRDSTPTTPVPMTTYQCLSQRKIGLVDALSSKLDFISFVD